MIIQAEEAKKVNESGGPALQSPSAVLMEASTGQIIYEKNADEKKESGQYHENYDFDTYF